MNALKIQPQHLDPDLLPDFSEPKPPPPKATLRDHRENLMADQLGDVQYAEWARLRAATEKRGDTRAELRIPA